MKNRKIKRFLALVLVLALTTTAVVGATADKLVGDLNGDGKITAFDAQMQAEANAGLRELTDTQKEASKKSTVSEIIDFVLGRETENVGKVYIEGYNVIQNANDLKNLANATAGEKYILLADIDLQGADWTPIRFAGEFYGNGHTISNLTINRSLGAVQGFFGLTTAEAVVKDLALRNVTLNAASTPTSVGLAVGISNGTLENVTVTGTIKDNRTAYGNNEIHIGALVGKVLNNSDSHTAGTSITVTDDYGKNPVSGLCADVKLYIKKDSTKVVHNGLYGSAASGAPFDDSQWRDNTINAYHPNMTDNIRQRQQIVVDYMNAMATVKWTPSETLTYTASGVHNQTFKAGTTYTGLPYNCRNGSLERFLSVMQGQNANGVYVTEKGLGNSTETGNASTGFAVYMGNDCSSAVTQAWNKASPTHIGGYVVENGQVVRSNPREYAGGVDVQYTQLMIPNLKPIDVTLNGVSAQITQRQKYCVYPVGEWTTVGTQGTENADEIVGEFAYNADEVYTSEDLLTYNSVETMAEAYAMTHKGDAIVGWTPSASGGAGHARLVTSYPVTIRNADGSIDLEKSFLVCTEQGDGLFDGNGSSWRVNYRWSFETLLNLENRNKLTAEDGNPNSVGKQYCNHVYMPITMRALRADYVKYAYLTEPVVVESPVIGETYTNFRTIKSVITVTDLAGNKLFSHETYTGLETVSENKDGYRGTGHYVNLAYAHGEAFKTLAKEHGLVAGESYLYSVELYLSNDQVLNVSRDRNIVHGSNEAGPEFEEFTYNP